ncbi:Uncharacterised protein [Burkholderia pseudomallei]|nr:Uncharacterised protein [Burkholderia pseudomallei]
MVDNLRGRDMPGGAALSAFAKRMQAQVMLACLAPSMRVAAFVGTAALLIDAATLGRQVRRA